MRTSKIQTFPIIIIEKNAYLRKRLVFNRDVNSLLFLLQRYELLTDFA